MLNLLAHKAIYQRACIHIELMEIFLLFRLAIRPDAVQWSIVAIVGAPSTVETKTEMYTQLKAHSTVHFWRMKSLDFFPLSLSSDP